MKILLTSATKQEIEPLLQWDGASGREDGMLVFERGQVQVHVLITGVGMIPATYHLTRAVARDSYDMALNFGLCGAYPGTGIQLGQVVNITSEQLGDTGAADGNDFLTVFDLGLMQPDEPPFTGMRLENTHVLETMEYYVDHSSVSSITVATASGEAGQINLRSRLFAPQVENMEGAAFFYVMLKEGIKFFEVRAVSNIVEPRNKEKWQISKAIQRLNDTAIEIVKFLACSNLMV